jgi:hypothetical protein
LKKKAIEHYKVNMKFGQPTVKDIPKVVGGTLGLIFVWAIIMLISAAVITGTAFFISCGISFFN